MLLLCIILVMVVFLKDIITSLNEIEKKMLKVLIQFLDIKSNFIMKFIDI